MPLLTGHAAVAPALRSQHGPAGGADPWIVPLSACLPARRRLGEPFLPYEQLLAVQPASSCRLLPQPYQHLMTDPHSPIADFYPATFRVDLEGKRELAAV